MTGLSYDRIGRTYTATRREDPRVAAAIWAGLGTSRTVLNVGAGAGAYEPPGRDVTAVEPSQVMIAQRPAGAAPVVRAQAEELPFADDSFDAAMAVLSHHHWQDRRRGFDELGRVARERVVLFNADPGEADLFWLTREYLPGFLELLPERDRTKGAWEGELRESFANPTLIRVPIPHDCSDGFYGAFWRRPEAYLHQAVRDGISVFAQLSGDEVRRGIDSLRTDLESGNWHKRHHDLLERTELHLGYYVVIAELRALRRTQE